MDKSMTIRTFDSREALVEALRQEVQGKTRQEITAIFGEFAREARRFGINPIPFMASVAGREVSMLREFRPD